MKNFVTLIYLAYNNCWQIFQDLNCSSLFFCYVLTRTSWYFVWKTKFLEVCLEALHWNYQTQRKPSATPASQYKKISDHEECQEMQIAIFLNGIFWWANIWNIDKIPLIYILSIYNILYLSGRKFGIVKVVLDPLVLDTMYGSSVESNYLS